MKINIKVSTVSYLYGKYSAYIMLLLISVFISNSVIADDRKISNSLGPSTVSSNSITENLQLADEIRSSDPKTFKTLINTLRQQKDLFSKEEKVFYNFIYGYYLAYRGKFNEAEIHFRSTQSSDTSALHSGY